VLGFTGKPLEDGGKLSVYNIQKGIDVAPNVSRRGGHERCWKCDEIGHEAKHCKQEGYLDDTTPCHCFPEWFGAEWPIEPEERVIYMGNGMSKQVIGVSAFPIGVEQRDGRRRVFAVEGIVVKGLKAPWLSLPR
jgi:hypothetical protein